MIEKIVDILKEFLEKHFLPFISSVVITGIVFFITPTDFKVLTKLEKNFYLLVLFCLSLLIIEISIILIRKINNKIYYAKENKKHNDRIMQENINYLYDLLDSLSPEEFDLVEYLVNNNNQYITSHMDYARNRYDIDSIFNSRRYKVKEDEIISIDPYNINKKCVYKKGAYVNQFKLREDIYENLKYLKNKTGKISRF